MSVKTFYFSVKAFLDIDGFIFVLGLSREALDKLITRKFTEMGLTDVTGEQYIRKVIQIEINIQKWESYAIRTLIEKLSDRLNYDDLKEPEIIDLIAKGVEHNLRQVKRLINRYVIVRSASKASNRQFETKKFFVGEILDDRWPNFYQRLTRPNFLTELKDYLDKTLTEQDSFFANLQKEKDAHKDKRLTDFEEIILLHKNDEDLWKFVTSNRETIIVSETKAKKKIEEASAVAKDWERYQRAKNSTNIPINTEQRREYDDLQQIKGYFDYLSQGKSECKQFLDST
jgi:succinate dehydrogenase flavin-adding protein (antitoxin of CptAB toxin-antitoxin module)